MIKHPVLHWNVSCLCNISMPSFITVLILLYDNTALPCLWLLNFL